MWESTVDALSGNVNEIVTADMIEMCVCVCELDLVAAVHRMFKVYLCAAKAAATIAVSSIKGFFRVHNNNNGKT